MRLYEFIVRRIFFVYKIHRNTASRLRFSLLMYAYVRSRRKSRALLVLLVFSNDKVYKIHRNTASRQSRPYT